MVLVSGVLFEIRKGSLTFNPRVLTFARRGWHDGYNPFRKARAETFIVVSPTQNMLFTCEPEAVNQFLRGNAFDKPADLLNILNILGPTMTGTSNQESHRYRKISTPFFNEDSMQNIWAQSLDGGQAALKVLIGNQKLGYVKELRPVFARLTLHLINSVCFELDKDCVGELEGRSLIPSGHSLRYSQALHTMIDHFKILFALPLSLLST